MAWQMYGWWTMLVAVPPAAGLSIWLWLSPTARRVLDRADSRCQAEHKLARLRVRGRISADEYQRAMAVLAHQTPQVTTQRPPRPSPHFM